MKRAKRRFVARFTFADGSTVDLDAIQLARKLTSQHERMASINSYIGDARRVAHYERLAHVERRREKRLNELLTQPRLDQVRKISADGGKATAEKYARPALDDLIRGCLRRGEPTRTYTKQWASDFGISVDVVERHIKRIKTQIR